MQGIGSAGAFGRLEGGKGGCAAAARLAQAFLACYRPAVEDAHALQPRRCEASKSSMRPHRHAFEHLRRCGLARCCCALTIRWREGTETAARPVGHRRPMRREIQVSHIRVSRSAGTARLRRAAMQLSMLMHVCDGTHRSEHDRRGGRVRRSDYGRTEEAAAALVARARPPPPTPIRARARRATLRRWPPSRPGEARCRPARSRA